MNKGKWGDVENEQCAKSLYPNGSRTTYESMGKFKKTCTIS